MLAVGLEEARVEVSYENYILSFKLCCDIQLYKIYKFNTPCHEYFLFQVMHLKSDYRAEDEDSCDRELERFLHYVSII